MRDLLSVADNIYLFNGSNVREKGVPRSRDAAYEYHENGVSGEIHAYRPADWDWEYVTVRMGGAYARLPNHLEMARIKDFFWEPHELALMVYQSGGGIPQRLALWRCSSIPKQTEQNWSEIVNASTEVVTEGIASKIQEKRGQFSFFQYRQLIVLSCGEILLDWYDVQAVKEKLGIDKPLVQFVTSYQEIKKSGLVMLWPASDMILPESLPEMK
ncbi:hypothetical protein IJ090_00015 [Candidatus Saccharibacteria bacterium]|nr:hypothetical protein [Candidatus Saccharibacteria bacterium]